MRENNFERREVTKLRKKEKDKKLAWESGRTSDEIKRERDKQRRMRFRYREGIVTRVTTLIRYPD